MNRIKTNILWYWVSLAVVFGIIICCTLIQPRLINFWGVIISLLYWIIFIYLYIREYNGLSDAVLRRFSDVYPKVFYQSDNIKDKYQSLKGWETNPDTTEMLREDLNIKNRYKKLCELDVFKVVVFICVIFTMIITLIKY